MTDYILSLSYGKDSLACLGAIEKLGWPLTRIIHAEVWATDTIPADLPPMVEFKSKADEIIKSRFGIEVEHIRSKWTYEKHFYFPYKYKISQILNIEKNGIYGFPMQIGPWCNSRLKVSALPNGGVGQIVYLGIATDEPERLEQLDGTTKKSPLAVIEWTENDCRKWCEENNLLSPIYTTATRGGCWFCHNQGIDQLRQLRRNYPELWKLLLKWDMDSPTTFHADGHTVHDFDRRFQLENEGKVPTDRRFRWKMLEKWR